MIKWWKIGENIWYSILYCSIDVFMLVSFVYQFLVPSPTCCKWWMYLSINVLYKLIPLHSLSPGAGLLITVYQLPTLINRKQKCLTKGHTGVPLIHSFFFPKIAQTTDGMDADLWKDGLFKSKVTRYLCFTRVFSKENVSNVHFFLDWILYKVVFWTRNCIHLIGTIFSFYTMCICNTFESILFR